MSVIKRAVLAALLVLPIAAAPHAVTFTATAADGPLQVGRALVVGSNDNGYEGNNLRSDLEALGLSVDRVADVPADLSMYQSVWYIEAYEGLLPAEADSLVSYSQVGGNLYLTGERPCCEELNGTVQGVLSRLLKDPNVQIGGMGDIDGPFSFNSGVTDHVATVPNFLVDFVPSSPGGIQGIEGVNSENVLARSASVVVGAVWAERHLSAGVGRVALLMDIDWLGNSNRLPIVENLANFLSAGGLCFGTSAGPVWTAGPANCSAINAPATVTWSAHSSSGSAPTMQVEGVGVTYSCTDSVSGLTGTTTCAITAADPTGAALRVSATSADGTVIRHYRVRPKNDLRNVPDGFAQNSNWWDWPDADEDGLPNKWETDGVWVKGQLFNLPSADPLHKDLYVRYDYQENYRPTDATATYMWKMFHDAPLDNPDGSTGVRLHLEFGSSVPASVVGNYDLSTDAIIRVGTYTGYLNGPQYGGGGVPPLYKSMLNFAAKPGSTIGKGFVKGQFAWTAWDLDPAWAAYKINLAVWDADARALASSFAQASNAAHELGHLLGLRHHNDGDKPQNDSSYKSIMSYAYSNFGLPGDGLWPLHHLDYSRTSEPKKDWKLGSSFGSLSFVSGQDGEIGDFYANTADDTLFNPGEDPHEITGSEVIESANPESILGFVHEFDAPADPSIPTLSNSMATVTAGSSIPITLDGADPDGQTITYLVDTDPTRGTVSVTPTGLAYNARSDTLGPDTFQVRATNGTLSSAPATVTVNISAAVPPPGPTTPAPTPTDPTATPTPTPTPTAATTTTTAAAVPARMQAPKVVTRGAKVIVKWKPAVSNGSAITRYLIDISKGRDKITGSNVRRLVYKRLKPGRYKFRVAATNATGTSAFSKWVTVHIVHKRPTPAR